MSYTNKKAAGITGASGLIGRELSAMLSANGYIVVRLKRDFTIEDIALCDIIINLAGAAINRRWSKKYKKLLVDSRIKTTARIADALTELARIEHGSRERVFISASAIGIYGNNSNTIYTEDCASYGEGFLARLCMEWEKEAQRAAGNSRVAITRFGLVMSKKGGALPKLLMPFKMGVSFIPGSGNQIISWITLEDLVNAMIHIINHPVEGIFNFTSPSPLSYREMAGIISAKYHTLFTLRLPEKMLRLFMGESSSVITTGQYVSSKRLEDTGFVFKTPRFVV